MNVLHGEHFKQMKICTIPVSIIPMIVKHAGFEVRKIWMHVPALPLTSVILGMIIQPLKTSFLCKIE